MSLDPIAKEVWCEALRSGEFKQCKGTLKDGDGAYCCLGVAREIFPALAKAWNGEMLDRDSLELLGLSLVDGLILIKMNDDGETFRRIADYIEREL